MYASTVVLDSISENLPWMAAEPNQTWLKSLKLRSYKILICACCQQILRGLSDSYHCLFSSQHHNIIAEMTTTSPLPQDQIPQQHIIVLMQLVREMQFWFILSKRVVLTGQFVPTSAWRRRPWGADQHQHWDQLWRDFRDGAQIGQGGEQDSHRQPKWKDGADHLCKRLWLMIGPHLFRTNTTIT